MAKKVVDPRTTALNALAQALADPGPKVLFGSAKMPGIFSGSGKAVKDAFNVCAERGWLEPSGEFVGKGAKAKEKYRITPAGVHAVLEESEPLELVRGLGESLIGQTQALEKIQAQVDQALASIQEQVGQMRKAVSPIAAGVATLEKRLQPPNLEEIRRKMSASQPTTAAAPRGAASVKWLDRAVQLAAEQRQRDRFQPLPLPGLFQQVQKEQPDLTLGQFHDGLRKLRDDGRIRLVPFTRALAQIDDPRNALFLDGEVMYYVDLP